MEHRLCIALSGCAVIGGLLVVASTPWGLGLSPDSAVYIGAARSLVYGKGYAIPTSSAEFAPITHFPPLYSALLACIGLLGVDPLAGARWLNGSLFAGNIFLAGFLVATSTRIFSAAIAGSLFMISSVAMVQAHSMAWSEPLFLFLQFVTILLLTFYSGNGKPWILFASASAAGLGVLVRYSGVALVFAGLVGIICLYRRSWREKGLSALQFFVISSLPISFWILRNFAGGGSVVNRQVGFHPPTGRDWGRLFDTISSWLLPSWVSPTTKELAFITALLLLSFAIIHLRRNKATAAGNKALQSDRLLMLTGLVALSHVGVLFASITFFDAQIPIDSRILLPVYASLVIFCVSIIGCLFENRIVGKQLKPGLMAGALFICALQLTDVSSWLNLSYRQGVGYASREWKDSALIKQLGDLSSQTLIGSNAPDVIYALLGRPSEMIPRKVFPDTDLPNENYFTEIAHLRKKINDRNGVVAYFNRVHWRWYLPSEQEIQKDMGLRPIAREKDGSLYQVDTETAGLEHDRLCPRSGVFRLAAC